MKESANMTAKATRKYTKKRMEELIEVFSDASRRMTLSDEQRKAAPTVEEAIDAIFGDVA